MPKAAVVATVAATTRKNRMYVALPMYGPVKPRFYQNWLKYQGQLARANDGPLQILTVTMPYIDHADTAIVQAALKVKNWDYLVLLEHDNIAPDDWASVIANELDPEIHKIVGRWYFGTAQEDMRAICGYLRPNGNFDRLSYDQVQHFRQHPGLYRVGVGMEGVDDTAQTFVIGMGCTAIHRSVFEEWTGPMPWFQSVSGWDSDKKTVAYLGHDVNFCLEAAKQGVAVWLDTRKAAGHVGDWVSDDETYSLTVQNMIKTGTVTKAVLSGKPESGDFTAGIPTAMSVEELQKLVQLATGKDVLEIGTRYGASTIGMAKDANIVYSLDWHRGDKWHGEDDGSGDSLERFWWYTGKYNLRDKIVPLVGRSDQVLGLLRPESFDFILVDGDHSYEGVKYDIQNVLPLLRKSGTVAVHDYQRELQLPEYQGTSLELGVTRAFDELLGEPDEIVGTVAIKNL